ncbi:MAG: hypothetical protein M3Y57_15110 [Acidobacteriota bacterium]|nr:hypothetical protein [Acidobacteriota bacterium]
MLLYSDPHGARLSWELKYAELSGADVQALQSHFTACGGPLRAFTFIDPTENMLDYSTDLTASIWQNTSGLKIAASDDDPLGGTAAFTLTNAGQANEEINQSFIVPANYQFCLSLYVRSEQPTTVTLSRRGGAVNENTICNTGPIWRRLISSGSLNDPTSTFTVAIVLNPGQQVQVFGPQLEPQIEPSRYRPTTAEGGVYSGAHWGVDQLAIAAEAPNLFSTQFSIETTA